MTINEKIEEKIKRTKVPELGLKALKKINLDGSYRDWIGSLVRFDERLDKFEMDCYSAISDLVYRTLEVGYILTETHKAHDSHLIIDSEFDEIEHSIEFPLWETILKVWKVCKREKV
jgi:hypothetical protein